MGRFIEIGDEGYLIRRSSIQAIHKEGNLGLRVHHGRDPKSYTYLLFSTTEARNLKYDILITELNAN